MDFLAIIYFAWIIIIYKRCKYLKMFWTALLWNMRLWLIKSTLKHAFPCFLLSLLQIQKCKFLIKRMVWIKRRNIILGEGVFSELNIEFFAFCSLFGILINTAEKMRRFLYHAFIMVLYQFSGLQLAVIQTPLYNCTMYMLAVCLNMLSNMVQNILSKS